MNRFLIALIVVLVACLAAPSWGQTDMRMAKEMIAEELRQNTFDKLISVNTVTLNTSASINFQGVTTATGSSAIAVPEKIPFMLKIHNHNVGSLTYNVFDYNATGVIQPTATSPHLLDPAGNPVVSGRAYKQIFHAAPNISIGASGATEVQVEIWGRMND